MVVVNQIIWKGHFTYRKSNGESNYSETHAREIHNNSQIKLQTKTMKTTWVRQMPNTKKFQNLCY